MTELYRFLINPEEFKQIKELEAKGDTEEWIVQNNSGESFSMKIWNSDTTFSSAVDAADFMNEISLIASFNHPAITKLIGYSFHSENVPATILTELTPLGTLKDVMNSERSGDAPVDWDITAKYKVLYGIASGMAYLHSKNIVHRSIQPASINLAPNLEPRISGFQMARFSLSKGASAILGVPYYTAPELYTGDSYTFASDAFSYAVLACALLTGNLRLESGEKATPGNLPTKIQDGERYIISDEIPAELAQLIQETWDSNPEKRPTFAQISEKLKNPTLFPSDADPAAILAYIHQLETSQQLSQQPNNAKSNATPPRRRRGFD